ncbi:MAG: hypothetical protein ABIV94_02120 [Acidimicrobiales bacterium]
MCMQCVAGAAPYVAGALGGLRLMGRSSRLEREAASDAPSAPARRAPATGAAARRKVHRRARSATLVDA